MPYHIFKTNYIIEALSFNMPVVFESFGSSVKCFVYHPLVTPWQKVFEFHNKRGNKWIISFCEVREISHPSHFENTNTYSYVDQWIDLGVSPEDILFIGNHHSMIDDMKLKSVLDLPVQSTFIRYFEADVIFRHFQSTIKLNYHQGPRSQTLDEILNYDKKYLALFGKPRKFMRSGAILKMHQKNIADEALISCLSEGKGIQKTIESASDFWDRDQLEKILPLYQGPVDDITYDAPETDDSNYRGYPYDPNLYRKTAISIVAETNDIPVDGIPTLEQFWVTEKICRTMYNFHPFVVLSTPYFLKNLRELGYQTFDCVIDESYDLQQDPELRLEMAIDSAQKLVQIIDDPKVRTICEHNHVQLQKTHSDTQQQMIDKICLMVTSKY